MKSKKILEAMNEIEDQYIEEAAPEQKEKPEQEAEPRIISMMDRRKKKNRKPFRQNGAAVAAACALLVLAGGIYGKIQTDMRSSSVASFQLENSEEAAGARAMPENAIKSEAAMDSEAPRSVQIANPWLDFETIEEAEEAAGFHISLPDVFREYTEQTISVLKTEPGEANPEDATGNMIEVVYRNKAGDEGLRIRMAARNAGYSGASVDSAEDRDPLDISGDYNVYERDEQKDFEGLTLRTRGTKEKVQLLSWASDSYSYAISLAEGLEDEADQLELSVLVGTVAKSEEINR